MEEWNIAIETSELAIGYKEKGKKKYLNRNLALRLYPGEVTSLIGVNGAGKSTLLRTLAGFLPPLEGKIHIAGRNHTAIAVKERAQLIGVALTGKSMAGNLTVFDLVALGRHPYTGFFGRLRPNDKRIIRQAMQRTGIAHRANSYVAELSDGERQKAIIAKALVQECPIILLDEPTAFLDVTSRIDLMILLRELAMDENKSILLSTHDIELALALSDQIWLMKRADGIVCGAPEDLVLNGVIGAYFDRETTCFDTATGRLSYVVKGNQTAFIESETEQRYWIANALKRCGYVISDTPDNASLHVTWPSCNSPIAVQFVGGETQSFSTVGEMVTFVKSIFLPIHCS